MRIARPLLMVAALSLAAACSDESSNDGGPLGLETKPTPEVARSPLSSITVMTRNMYVGANVDAVIAALITPDPADDQAALFEAISTLQETAFPARAAAIAEEIARRPSARDRAPGGVQGGHHPAATGDRPAPRLPAHTARELEARGLHYDVAARVTNIQAAPFAGVSVVDEDALLVDPDRVEVHGTDARSFSANIGPVAPGVVLARGWVSASVTVDGKRTPSPAPTSSPATRPGLDQLRAAQATELAGALSGAGPTVLVGDLNDVPGSPCTRCSRVPDSTTCGPSCVATASGIPAATSPISRIRCSSLTSVSTMSSSGTRRR